MRLGGSRRTQMYPFSRCLPLVQGAIPRTAPWLPRAPRHTRCLSTAPLAPTGQGHAQERAYEIDLSPL